MQTCRIHRHKAFVLSFVKGEGAWAVGIKRRSVRLLKLGRWEKERFKGHLVSQERSMHV